MSPQRITRTFGANRHGSFKGLLTGELLADVIFRNPMIDGAKHSGFFFHDVRRTIEQRFPLPASKRSCEDIIMFFPRDPSFIFVGFF